MIPMQIFAIFCLFGDGHSNSCEIISRYGFNLHFCNDCGDAGLAAQSRPPLLRPHGLQPARLLCPRDFPARKLELVAICSSRGSSPPRGWTGVSCAGRRILYHWATREAPFIYIHMCIFSRIVYSINGQLNIKLGFPGGSDGKESACIAGDLSSIPGLGRSPGERNSNPLQYSCLQKSHGWRSLAGYSPWGWKELDTTEWLDSLSQK